jgi:hypothetical protein
MGLPHSTTPRAVKLRIRAKKYYITRLLHKLMLLEKPGNVDVKKKL